MRTIFSRIGIAISGLTFILSLINIITSINPLIIVFGCALTLLCMFVSQKYGEKTSALTYFIWIILLMLYIAIYFKHKNHVDNKEETKTEITYKT